MDLDTAQQTGVVFGIAILLIVFSWFLWTISPKLFGIVLLCLGGFIVLKLPGISKYERAAMTSAIIAIGIVLIVIGGALIIFA